ncbi:outer membrane beta-barrel protein [Grimontia sp. NTOU-MAR1]|uniref:outer membrane beta-barrel protein n=1 Tax=Grimontia sp. NTOU-MAR1 TaxID=3111011 RepID=UPI002DBF6BD6|nr:outer membrane beta-barrel protein [Grimontia sp. NTOU-MAR1]WRV99973.1 outer membrane beta-barrel protein [Grimontia sp. NTOU-MAR1]
MKHFIVLLVSLLASFPSLAQQHQIGLGLGGADLDGRDSDVGFAAQFNYSYQFQPNFAAEIGHIGASGIASSTVSLLLGETTETIDFSNTYLGMRANHYLLSFVNAYAMGGATYSEVEKSIEVKKTGAKTTDTSDGLGGYIGAGLELVAFDSIGFGLEYRRFFMHDNYKSNGVLLMANIKF